MPSYPPQGVLTKEVLESIWQSGGAGREALREELASREIVGLPYVYDLDSVFQGFINTGDTEEYGVLATGEKTKASEYWSTSGLRCPSNAWEVSVWSRRTFRYPKATVAAKLPVPESGAFYFPICLYTMGKSEWGGPIDLRSWDGEGYNVLAPGEWRTNVGYPRALIQDLLPSDYSTAFYAYTVKVNRWGVELFIRGRLRGVLIATQRDTRYGLYNTLPYAIGVGYANLASEYAFGIRVGNTSTDPAEWAERLLPISPHFVAVGDGDPCPPRALHLYVPDSDTRLAGQSISSGSITSHPFPLFGYPNKTVYFMADQAGTLDIEVLTLENNWRTYDSVAISANTLLSYVMTGEAVLGRVTFTPSAYPATILEAEVALA